MLLVETLDAELPFPVLHHLRSFVFLFARVDPVCRSYLAHHFFGGAGDLRVSNAALTSLFASYPTQVAMAVLSLRSTHRVIDGIMVLCLYPASLMVIARLEAWGWD